MSSFIENVPTVSAPLWDAETTPFPFFCVKEWYSLPLSLPLSDLFYSLNRLSLWPLHCCLQDGKDGIGGEQDKLILLTGSSTKQLPASAAPPLIPQDRPPPPQNWRELKLKISRLWLEMTVVSSALQGQRCCALRLSQGRRPSPQGRRPPPQGRRPSPQ